MAGELFNETLTPEVSTGNPRTVNDATQKAPMGAVIRWKGNKYMYVKFNNGQGNVAAVAGGFVHWMTGLFDPPNKLFTVTSDQTDAIAGRNSVAGVIGNVVTDGNYTWIQITGVYEDAKVTSTTDLGDCLVGSATDLVLQEGPITYTPDLMQFGVALEAATTAAVVNVLLRNLDW